jgi:hypothetical protein
MLSIRTKAEFAKSKLRQFSSIAQSEEVKTQGLLPTLKKYGYGIQNAGGITMCTKGKASIIYQGEFNLAQITVVI